MMLSDARTRGPWHKMWVRFMRANDIKELLFQCMTTGSTEDFEMYKGSHSLAVAEETKIMDEIRRALTAGADESDQESDRPVPVDPIERYQQFLLKLGSESNQPDPSSGD